MEGQQCPGCGRFVQDGEILVNFGGQHVCMSCMQHFSRSVVRDAVVAAPNSDPPLESWDAASTPTSMPAGDELADIARDLGYPSAPPPRFRKPIKRGPKPRGYSRIVLYGAAHLVLAGVLITLWVNGTFARWTHHDLEEPAPAVDSESVEQRQINALVVEANDAKSLAEKTKKLELAIAIAERSPSAEVRARAQKLKDAVTELRNSIPGSATNDSPVPHRARVAPAVPRAAQASPLFAVPSAPSITPATPRVPSPTKPADKTSPETIQPLAGGVASDGAAPSGSANIFADAQGAQKVAFVCDASGSMIPKLAALRRELEQAIGALRPTQQFGMTFFADKRAIAFQNGALVYGTDDNKRAAHKWLDEIFPGGQTDPLPSLDIAFRSKPELLYVLTDGDFDNSADVMRRVAALNKDKRTRVNTVALIDKDADAASQTSVSFLTALAEQNRGKFTTLFTGDAR